MTAQPVYDLLVVGGGINGAGIARDAAGRGLRVLLCEQDDLASHTSSASSKLIHGGLRYLENYEFRLVSKALAEREVLLRNAPHIIRPLRFVMPHVRTLRPAWMIRLGLMLYDRLDLGKRKLLPTSHGIDLRRHPAGAPLSPRFRKGFEYSDGWVDDARLVLLNAIDAAARGADILTRTRCVEARRRDDVWAVRLLDRARGESRDVHARALVNAAGPWVSEFLTGVVATNRGHRIRLVKGSHLVVPRLFEHDFGYIFQNTDRRVVFALPYERDYTLIGTTEVDFETDPAIPAVDDSEVAYLCEAVNQFFEKQTAPADVVHAFAGVRPLLDDDSDDASSVTRDYLLDLDCNGAPLLSVFGGKITTFRKLAEESMALLDDAMGLGTRTWTETAPFPGGDIDASDFGAFARTLQGEYPWLPGPLLERYARAYGTRARRMLGPARSIDELGEDFGGGLYAAEVEFMRREEWAVDADDVLWRRSKLALHVGEATKQRLRDYLAATPAGGA